MPTNSPAAPAPPKNRPPSVQIKPLPENVTANTPVQITVIADEGVRWKWIAADQSWDSEDFVTYTETEVDIPGVESIRDHRGGGGTYSVTFPRPGGYSVSAAGVTSDGAHITAAPVNVHVSPAGPPVFTWVAPADGTVVDLVPGGASVEVVLTSADQYYPLSVDITFDGMTTTQQYGGSEFRKTITLSPAPLGTRSITVKCTDPDGRASTQTRSVVGHDGAPPTVTLDAFDSDVEVASLPYVLTLTGTTPGASSGVTEVRYSVANGSSGVARNTAAGGDLSTWQAEIALPTTGTFALTVTATDSRGGTASVAASITLHL
ncbi:hypothetical protein ACOT81_37295 [Streptomyces sp. WI04-05B]|uniref:hypothetical protein n=1 Tax=Streptomyces TaxID=1883 RepID=UPI0029B23A5E|nr:MULTISPECIES: hypothetical protein [unclassified Streptomyces]MDX2547459.1 hypothetical protein [Streptomyces sp. WI04-05B]MDX2586282.1 hypothetical protein [Streptomyces sp. WI04-05A]MDX3748932.1 hypothetical protein [Streptomyces sp. AK08-02]